MTVSIMITNWNGKERLQECLPSVVGAWRKTPEVSEVLVVDDASSDGSVEYLKLSFPGVRIVRNERNLGFIGSTNMGVREARGDIVVLLNNDVKVREDFLAPVLGLFNDPKVFAVTFQALFEDEKTFREGGKSMRFALGFPHLRHALRHQMQGTAYSLYAVGGHCAVRREMFLSLGGFDDLFHPLYWDDVDISWRAWKNGWKTLYEPGSVVYHKEKGTMRSTLNDFKVKTIRDRNRLLFVWKNIHSPHRIGVHVLFLIARLVTSVFSRDLHYYPAVASAFRRFPQAYDRRRKEKNRGGVGESVILRVGWPEAER